MRPLKQYFTDGLVQIAIVLSLLRIDLNNYLNTNYVNYPEVQELLLGQTAIYTQTNFHHRNYEHMYAGHQHLKTIDNDVSIVLQDLRSLSRFSYHLTTTQNRRITTFLVGITNGANILSSQTPQEVENDNDEEVTPEGSTDEISSDQGHAITDNSPVVEDVILGAESPPAGDPSFEDLDLIEVLWRQDIDLGVGKEVFDINLRRELEREREIELQKERQKQKDRELLQMKLEDQRRRQEQQWLTENFMRDGETGEWVPLNGRRASQTVSSPPMVPNIQPSVQNMTPQVPNMNQQNPSHNINQSHQYQNFTTYDNNMPMMNSNMQQHINRPVMTSNPPYQMSPHPAASPQQMTSPMTSPLHHMAREQNHLQTFNYPQQQNQTTYHDQVPYNQSESMEPMDNGYPPQNSLDNGYPPQNSLDETWMDLVNLLELPSNETNGNMMDNMSQGRIMPGDSQPNHSNVLIQNATMPAPINTTANTPGFEQSARTNFTSSSPSEGCSSPLEWNNSNMLFPNNTNTGDQNSTLSVQVDNILANIIDEGLDDLNITEMALEEGLGSMQMLDDASSESGISMGSSGGSPSRDQFSDSAMSPFDGMEGARGGDDFGDGSPDFNKGPQKFSFNGGYNYKENGNEASQLNYSSSSNDTDYNYRPASANHIRHNHSYPLQPGQEPREYKKYSITDKPKQKGPHCRDKKRLEELKVPLSLDQIVDSPVEEFNEILTHHKLTETQLQLIRDIRRRGKNKVAAQNCRKRKMDVIITLEDEMTQLKESRDKLLAERHMIDKQTRDMKEKYGSLYREIFLSLRDEHGRPYDPSQFSLQQSSDGNVFLVPKNITADEQLDIKKERKDDRKKDSH